MLLIYTGDTFTREHGRERVVLIPVVTVSTPPESHGNAGQFGHVSYNPLLDVGRWNVWLNGTFDTSMLPPFRDIFIDIFCH